MKIDQIVKEDVSVRRLKWTNNPTIGWIREGQLCRLYYGTPLNKVKAILREGIFAGDDGYILCAAEPNTAYSHAAMRILMSESKYNTVSITTNRAVFVVDVPRLFLKTAVIENDQYNRFTTRKLYESWGKSDVEYYALIGVKVQSHIPVRHLKGYMVKDGS